MKRSLEVLNRLIADGIIRDYAIGGAMGATFYQFLPVYNALLVEALENARTISYEEVPSGEGTIWQAELPTAYGLASV